MKKYLLYLTATFLTAHFADAQVLYTEDFNNLSVGNVGTDITGQTLGQGGWYTLGAVNTGNNIVTNTDFQIVPENTKGNILTIKETSNTVQTVARWVYRSDIETFWNQRTPGNDILKLSFDLYTGTPIGGASNIIRDYIYFTYGQHSLYLFCNFYFNATTKTLRFHRHAKNDSIVRDAGRLNGYFDLILPTDSWVTVELYIDYSSNKYYVSVPSLSHTVAFDFVFPMILTDPVNEEDPVNGTPQRLYFLSNLLKNANSVIKYDNINISATNVTPTVSVNTFTSGKFNLYPNPVTDIVTITNSENIAIEEITVYDVTGKKIKTKKYGNENNIQLNLSDLAMGTYFLHIKTNQGTAVKKMIKK